MERVNWEIPTLVMRVGEGMWLAEPLLFPEISCCSRNFRALRRMVARRARRLIRDLEAHELWRRRLGARLRIAALDLEIPPLPEDARRESPVNLRLHYVYWEQGRDSWVAYVPALRIEVLGEDLEALRRNLAPQVQSGLTRLRANESLHRLEELQRWGRPAIRRLKLRVKLLSAKERFERQEESHDASSSALRETATRWDKTPASAFYGRDDLLRALARLLTGRSPRSVLLAGPSGSGKTALVAELARQRQTRGLAESEFWTTSGSRIVAGQTGFGMWQERCQRLVREASRRRSIIHLGNLMELIETGKGGGNSMGVAAMLRPAIADGRMLVIAECAPEQLAVIEREDPRFLEAFFVLEVPATGPAETREILGRVAEEMARQGGRSIGDEGLDELARLHGRFSTYSAMPGRAIRFLRGLLAGASAMATSDDGRPSIAPLEAADVTEAFSRETGLPKRMLDPREPLPLDETRQWFADRVIGQRQPVELVVDLLATVKAGLARPGKPLASLLFIGPTGVGKTELAKTLAEFLYQDAQRMIRFDMSEYGTEAAIQRLIGGLGEPRGLLTQRVRDQPFMVVLLDEFEKAHPLLFDVLLQVLGEGRLTDSRGCVADFTNSVVIMTSNLGVESYRPAGLGFGGGEGAELTIREHFEREVRGYLRPEFFNRIDCIAPFLPLGEATLRTIVEREASRVAQRDGLRRRETTLRISDEALDFIVAAGSDARYGARPLQRAIERFLAAPIAARVAQYGDEVRIDCSVTCVAGALAFETVAQPRLSRASRERGSVAVVDVLTEIAALRREAQRLARSGAVTRLRNDLARLMQLERERERLARRRAEGGRTPYVFNENQARALANEALLRRVDELEEGARRVETAALEPYFAKRAVDVETIARKRADLEKLRDELLGDLYLLVHAPSARLTLVILGADRHRCLELAAVYSGLMAGHVEARDWLELHDAEKVEAESRGAARTGERARLALKGRVEREDAAPQFALDVLRANDGEWLRPPASCVGLALRIQGAEWTRLLESEGGRHLFVSAAGKSECVVEVIAGTIADYRPPPDVGRAGSFAELASRRVYDEVAGQCRDTALGEVMELRRGGLADAVREATQRGLAKRTWRLLEE